MTEKEFRKLKKIETKNAIRTGSWEDIIQMFADELKPDIDYYRDILEKGGASLEMLRDMALNRSVHIHRQDSGSIEISFRKGDHTAVTIVTVDGQVRTMMKDFLDY